MTTTDSLPIDTVPVTLYFQHTNISTTINYNFLIRIPTKTFSWQEYITEKQPWEHDIIQTILQLDKEELLNRLYLGKTIYVCLDGGANKIAGSFATVLATENTILISLHGRVYGETPGSFYAEAAGMLAPLHYLQMMKEYYKLQDILPIIQITDSESLIMQIKESKYNPPLSAREYMKSKIDLEMKILHTLWKLAPSSHTLHHVKGHQDNTKHIESLTWNKKMNVYCDFMATKELQKITSPSTTIPLLPASRIKLDIWRVTITHHMALQIRYRHSKIGVRQRLMEKINGTKIFQKTNMDLFRQNFTSFSKIQQ